ncbi:MAG: hypothetical protein C0459_00795 [Chitinophaga sp.]|jgi:periplasmic protein TonB|nr:hypothetical protein [Chitinophaga sp.]
MKPEQILKSHVLDIVFENRNKQYGAYELRSRYNNRLLRAIMFTSAIVLLFALLQSWKVPHKKVSVYANLDGVKLTAVEIPKEEVKKDEAPKPKKVHVDNIASATDYVPKIVPDDKVNKKVNDQALIDSVVIGDKDTPGLAATGLINETLEASSNGVPNSTGNTDVKEVVVEDKPLIRAEFMPEFPGGKEAFLKFMQKNLRQPDDLEEGQKINVIARFVVEPDGSIEGLDIIQQGREDLNKEVIRVLRKMPKWKPGMQNGRAVPVYFKVPITFMTAD